MNNRPIVINPLRRDGTSQQQRFPAPLDPRYISLDERQIVDLLDFSEKFAKQIQYWNSSLSTDGDWVPFLEYDPSMVLAHVLKTPLEIYRTEFLAVAAKLEADVLAGASATTLDQDFLKIIRFFRYPTYFTVLLGIPDTKTVLWLLDDWCLRISPETGMDQVALGIVQEESRARFLDLIRIEYEWYLVRNSFSTPISTYAGFGPVWGDYVTWYNDTLVPLSASDAIFYSGPNGTVEECALNVLRGLRSVFEAMYNACLAIAAQAVLYFPRSLDNYSAHEPYMALYITFLQLFRHSQAHINGLTERHLEFYYQDVLQMFRQNGLPDRANILFKLRGSFNEYLLPKGSLLSAGKDATGKLRQYATESDIVLNRAEVSQLRSLFFARTKSQPNLFPPKGTQVFSASVANSPDGKGGKFLNGQTQWNTMGEDQAGKPPHLRTMADGEIGFAVSSPDLYMTGGRRYARFLFQIDNDNGLKGLTRTQQVFLEAAIVASMKVKLSAEKGWHETRLSRAMILTGHASLTAYDGLSLMLQSQLGVKRYKHFSLEDELHGVDFRNTNVLLLEVELSPDEPAIVPFNPAKLAGGYDATQPVAVFTFDNEGQSPGRDWFLEIPLTAVGVPTVWRLFQGNYFIQVLGTEYRYQRIEDYFVRKYSAYDADVTYPAAGVKVLYNGKVYRALRNSGSPIPEGSADFWNDIVHAPPGSPVPLYDSATVYGIGDRVIFGDRIYEAIRNSISPAPDQAAGWWVEEDYSVNLYDQLAGLALRSLKLKVDVNGLENLQAENDLGPINIAKPFEPFGARPEKGAKFAIGSGEVFGKELTEMHLDLEWMDAPVDFSDHYAAYVSTPASTSPTTTTSSTTSGTTTTTTSSTAIPPVQGLPSAPSNSSFVANASIKFKGEWYKVRPGGIEPKLFDPVDATEPVRISLDFTDNTQDLALEGAGYARAPRAITQLGNAAQSSRGFFRLELAGPNYAFGHRAFTDLYTRKVLAESYPLPKEPYTPKLKSISMSYTSESVVDIDSRSSGAFATRIDRFFHVHPFGQGEVHGSLLAEDQGINLLPTYLEEGALIIGLKNFDTPRTLSLFFQLAEGSADPDLPRTPLRWQYLQGNNWVDLAPVRVLSDSTRGLRGSGIVVLDMPEKADSQHSILPNGLHWIKVAVAANTVALDKAVAVDAQAVTVRFVNNDNDPQHAARALPALTISSLSSPRSAVEQVRQPFASFGGKLPDTSSVYWTRVSERLRHKARSSTVWDYERMVLEQFPEIYKAKCINHTNVQCEISPGHVTVVTIPDLRNRNAVNVFEPRTSLELLERIREYLLFTVSPTVQLHVRNPLYEGIRVQCLISFHKGYDPGYYSRQLEQDIQRFLSPWAFEEGKDIVFGGRIHRSFILNFIEERPYVDYVIAFKMDHIVDGILYPNVQEAVATTSRSVLVSAQAHFIRPLAKGDYACAGSENYEGIDFWIIDSDFIVQ